MDGSDTNVKPQPILLNDLYIDPIGYQVKLGKREVELTLKEFNLLYHFACNSGKVVRRDEILRTISDPDALEEDGAVNVVICRLRKKIEADPHHPKRLVSVRGLGYRLKG
jgi:DNA-binding response OmpR family regulator